jgi:hypothetical protein
MRLLMKCDHVIDIDANKVAVPTCWCGEQIVARPLGAPVPRIVGHAQGPLVESKYLGPTELDLTTKGAAPLIVAPADEETD